MEPTFAAAIEHIRLMETRIQQQEAAIERIESAGQDAADATRRLNLLHSALHEMRIQIAQLAPTEKQLAAPAWALSLNIQAQRPKSGA